MINFLERILRMPRVIMTIMVILLGAGLSAYLSLPKESFPAIDIPYFYVSVTQTGVSPRDAETLLAKPIEDRIKDLDDLENYTSTSSTGHAGVFLEFNVNADKDQALSDVRAALDGVTSELPADADEPTGPTAVPTPRAAAKTATSPRAKPPTLTGVFMVSSWTGRAVRPGRPAAQLCGGAGRVVPDQRPATW